jgi:ribonucleoside-triphosphate reductase (formate)
LKNNFADLGYYNSIGGAALKVGSVKVSTINLARIAYESANEQEYLTKLKEVCEINLKMLDCQRHIIQRNIEKGLLHTFDCKMIEMKFLYSSIGIMGCYETMKKFGYTYTDEFNNTYYKPEAFTFGQKIFKTIHNVKDVFMIDKDYHVNLEAIPKYQLGL